MNLVRCDPTYAEQILAIYNHAIATSAALYEYQPRTMETMAAWFETKRKGNYPVIGAVADDGALMGFGSYGAFRPQAGYKYTVEHSVYVAEGFRGRGVGKRLLQEVVMAARAQNYHALIGVIDSENAVSLRLHRKLGFQPAGTMRQVGFKFGRWLDVEFYQLILDTPLQPLDG